ncbi:MAG: phage minor head protein [Bacilli bacterium]
MNKDKGHIETDLKLERLEKRLTKEYSEATKELQKKLKLKLKELETWEENNEKLKSLNIDEYNRKRQGKLFEIDRKKKIIKNLSLDISAVNQQAMDILNDTNLSIYAINHNYILGSIVKQGADISFEIYNKNIVYNLLKKNTKLFPKRKINVSKDLLWNYKKIKSELIQGIIQGKSTRDIAKNFQKVTDMNKNSAIRNAQTSVTNVENKARIDGIKYAESLGIELFKEWKSSGDNHTRDSHAMLNGKKIDIDDKFSNGLMYPGDPSGRPEEVYNCRCCLVETLKKDYRDKEETKAWEEYKKRHK